MSTLIVLVTAKENWGFPPTQIAGMYLAKAKALGHDYIRVEQGPRVSEYPVSTVERFLLTHGLQPSIHRTLRRDRGDWDLRRPVYPGWRSERV